VAHGWHCGSGRERIRAHGELDTERVQADSVRQRKGVMADAVEPGQQLLCIMDESGPIALAKSLSHAAE
jgi:hypothetical protein